MSNRDTVRDRWGVQGSAWALLIHHTRRNPAGIQTALSRRGVRSRAGILCSWNNHLDTCASDWSHAECARYEIVVWEQ